MSQTDQPTDSIQLARKTSQGLVWNFITYGLSKGIVLLTTSILARLISKDDFGMLAIAMVAINYLAVAKDLGLGAALIQRKGNFNEIANTVFSLNLIIGIILSVFAFPLAPLFGAYFEDPQVIPIIRLLGASFFINCLGTVHVAKLQKELDFRRKMVADIGSAVIKGIVSITMALTGFGIWALVIGQLSRSISNVILVWIIVPWRPKLMIDFKIGKELLRFGASIMGSDALEILTSSIDTLVVGRVFSLAELSIYSQGFRLPEMLILSNLWVMGGVFFPAFSSIQDKFEELKKGFLLSIRIIEIIVIPISLGLFIAAEPIILVVFGDEWIDVIPILRVFAAYAWISSIGYHVGGVYKAIGRPHILTFLSVLTLILIIPALFIGAGYGLIGVAIGHLIVMIFRRSLGLFLATRFVGVSLKEIASQLIPSGLSGIAMTIVLVPFMKLTDNLNEFLQLPLCILVAAIAYLSILFLLERKNIGRWVNQLSPDLIKKFPILERL